MANGLDRLERLFAYKRKASYVPDEPESPVTESAEPEFPSPSFIRPKGNRMAARLEVRRQGTGRSPSVPDISTSQRTNGTHTPNSGSTDSSTLPKHSLLRSPSFDNGTLEPLIASLCDFKFPAPSTEKEEVSPLAKSFHKKSSEAPRLPSPRCRSPIDLGILQRATTPPSSDPEDDHSDDSGVSGFKNQKVPNIRYGAPPTPRESPEFGPVPDLQLEMSKSVGILDKALYKDIQRQLGEPFEKSSSRTSFSQSSFTASHRFSSSSSILREPDFNEFLSLSDDDIAESTLESSESESSWDPQPVLPSMELSISSFRSFSTSLLTLTPPRAAGPATAAAFEAARIANRYDFDLVYIVNLWPDKSRPQTSGPRLEGAPGGDLNMSQTPLVGRLLAAHGLEHVSSPLQIHADVHTAILRSSGWTEYRDEGAQAYDLARGYANTFCSGQYTRGTPASPGDGASSDGASSFRLSAGVDHGIVFAAYRKPRPGKNKLGRSLSREELGDLYKDAEGLVEMLRDIHVASQQRQPSIPSQLPDETGPMPDLKL